LPYNPAADVKPPKVERRQVAVYSLTQTADLLEALRGSWMHVPALLAVLCGLRRGEIAALRWGSVDLDKGRLAVVQSAEQTRAGVRYKEPKSGQARTVALSAAVVGELRAHRTRRQRTCSNSVSDWMRMRSLSPSLTAAPMTLIQSRKSGACG